MTTRRPLTHPSRASILEAACRRFARRGYEGVSVREIAADCGVNLPSIYHFYGNKAALYDASRDAVLQRLTDALDAALDRARGGIPRDRAFVVALRRQLSRDEQLLPFLESRHPPAAVPGTPLGAAFERFAALLAGSAGEPVEAARRAAALVLGLAIGCEIAARLMPASPVGERTLQDEAQVIHDCAVAAAGPARGR